jgi:hypothetical protein
MKKRLENLPFVVLAITLASFPLDKWNPFFHSLNPAEQPISLPQIFTVLTMLVWLFYVFFLGRTQYLTSISKSPITFCALIYLGASLLSVTVSPDPILSLKAVLKRTALFATFLLIINIVRDRQGLRLIVTVLAVSTIAYLLSGLYEFITGEMFLGQMAFGRTQLVGSYLGKIRIQGLETDPDLLAMMLLILSGPVLFKLISAKKPGLRLFWIAVFFWIVVNVIAIGSRWGWIGMGTLIGISFFVLHFPRKTLIAIVTLSVFACTFAVMAMMPSMMVVEKIERLFSGMSRDIGISERKAKLKMSVDMLRLHPILGVGSGVSGKLTPKYLRRGSRIGVREIESSISGYTTLMGDNGLLGFAAYNFMLLMIFLEILKSRMNEKDRDWKNLGGCILISLLAFVFCMIAFPALGCRYAWVIYALGAAYGIMSKHAEPSCQEANAQHPH